MFSHYWHQSIRKEWPSIQVPRPAVPAGYVPSVRWVQCTEYAQRYLYLSSGTSCDIRRRCRSWVVTHFPPILVKTTTPVHGDIKLYWGRLVRAGSVGHNAVIDVVRCGCLKRLTFVDENGVGKGDLCYGCASMLLARHSEQRLLVRGRRREQVDGGTGGKSFRYRWRIANRWQAVNSAG